MNYLSQNRNKHYHLNHFNIQQLTYLCKELASTTDYKDQVYQLLASVLPEVDQDIILTSLKETFRVNDNEQEDETNEEGKRYIVDW